MGARIPAYIAVATTKQGPAHHNYIFECEVIFEIQLFATLINKKL